jgi:hypothetical protein
MNYPQISPFEEKVHLATQMPDPSTEFAGALWERVIVHPQRLPSWEQRFHNFFSKPAWALIASVLLVVALIAALAGPQRVLAALQGILGYIPGVGFVSTENAAAMREPVELTQNGQMFQVEQLLSSNKETVLVVRLHGFPAYQNIGLDRGISLAMADGKVILPGSFAVNTTATPGEYTGVFKFSPLPVGTRQITVAWKSLSGAQSAEPAMWQIPVTLFPISDPDIVKLLPNSYEPDHASASLQGITLKIDQVSSSSSDTAVRLQMIFPQVFEFARPNSMVLMDDLGKTYQNQKGQVHFEDNGQPYQVLTTPGPTQPVFRSLLETHDFPAIDPAVKQLALQVNQLNFRASPYATFAVDLGSRPSVGDRWPIDQLISIGDIPLRVNSARLVSLGKDAPGGNGQPMMGFVLDIEPVNPGQIQLNQIWLTVWGAQQVYDPTTSTWAAAWLPDQVPSGTIDIHLTVVQGILNGEWKIQWEHQKP